VFSHGDPVKSKDDEVIRHGEPVESRVTRCLVMVTLSNPRMTR
jgi:hypothetical protein